MKKGTLILWIFIFSLLMFAVPSGLMYYYDTIRVKQLNSLQSEIQFVEKKGDVDIIKKQMRGSLEEFFRLTENITEKSVYDKYSSITGNHTIRNSSYSRKSSKNKIAGVFKQLSSKFDSGAALLQQNGRILAANGKPLKTKNFSGNTKFLQAIASKKIISSLIFSEGAAEYFIPVIDAKNRVVSVLYVYEDISALSEKIRKNVQSPRGYNFIIDATGTVLLSTDRSKENIQNIQQNRDIRTILTGGSADEGIKEAEYSNLKGLFAYKKHKDLGVIFCMFTPYSDYKNLKQENGGEYSSVIYDTKFFVPVYALLAGGFFIFFLIIAGLAGSPYKPIKKIVRALRHVDEDSFELMLPKIRRGAYKRVIDALVILKGRVKAAEEKTQRLSNMSKELEEELSKEASRADMEISELRDAVKIAENNKTRAEEEILKIKEEADKEKKTSISRIEEEKDRIAGKINELEKENLKLKEEIKKAHESKIPAEKENMRMESVLMMNTELKGVLSVIKTYISSVLGGEGKITDAQQQFLGVVINKSARLERLINDLTELARLERSEIKTAKQPVDVNNIIQDILFAIQPQADVKKVEIKTEFSPSLPTVLADSSKLSSVITQLITQAIKVSPRGSRITAETKEEGNNVSIRLTDFGMSMPRDKAKALFLNFHGPESSAGPEFINTGLRFPIIKAVIENMDGEIRLESEIGKGKTFVILLPKDNRNKDVTGSGSFNTEEPAPD
ncbi:MAG: ATP-binding protein, partial [bacterium]